jgi:hypothetical protein
MTLAAIYNLLPMSEKTLWKRIWIGRKSYTDEEFNALAESDLSVVDFMIDNDRQDIVYGQ